MKMWLSEQFAFPSARTWIAFPISIFIASAICCEIYFVGYWHLFVRPQHINFEDLLSYNAHVEVVQMAARATLILAVPAMLVLGPLYIFMQSRSRIMLWHCLLAGTITIAVILGILVFDSSAWGRHNFGNAVYLLFLIPGLIAGFVFHRIDQRRWF